CSVVARGFIRVEEYRIAFTLRYGYRNDLVAKLSGANRGDSLAMAVQREFVLAFAADVIAFGHNLSGVTHVEVFVRVPQAVMNHRVDDGVVAEPVAVACAGQKIRRVGHAFHAARDDNFRITGLDSLRGKTNRLQARSA